MAWTRARGSGPIAWRMLSAQAEARVWYEEAGETALQELRKLRTSDRALYQKITDAIARTRVASHLTSYVKRSTLL
jgi:hypothetical protein